MQSFTADELAHLVKRNTILLSTGQAVSTISIQLNALIAAIAVFEITGDPAISGLVSSVTWGGRVFVSYISGWLMDRRGRRPVLFIGGILMAVSLTSLGWLFAIGDLKWMLASFFLLGCGIAILAQNRTAVADMYPESRMGSAIGYLYTSSIVGSLVAIPFVGLLEPLSTVSGLNRYTILWAGGAALLLPVLVATLLIRPDTKEIATVMKRRHQPSEGPNDRSDSYSMRSPGMIVAFVVSSISTGIMVTMMSLLSLHMNEHSISMALISTSITIHTLGMFAFSLPLGRISDRFGARPVMVAGSLVTGVGGLLTPLTTDYYVITLGIFLVGLGWSAATVSSTALLGSLTGPSVRGRIMGLNDVLIGVASIGAPLGGGLVIAAYDFTAFGLYGLLLSVPAVVLAIVLGRR